MKKIYRLLLTLPLAAMSWACSDNVIDDLSGTYGDIERYTFTTETTGETQKLKKGLKYLDMEFADAANNTFNLRVVSREWALQPGTYTPMASVGDEPVANTFYGFVANGNLARGAITEGELTVTLIDGTYYISGLLSGSDSHRYVVNYRGPIEFVAGVDDPEPSGYTVMLKVDPLTVTDPATWQPVPVPGMSKYTLAISDPEGKDAAFLEAANREGMTLAELAGTYTIAGSPAEPWLIDNGWLVPDYGMAGGAYVVAPDGEKQYIVQGTVRIEAAREPRARRYTVSPARTSRSSPWQGATAPQTSASVSPSALRKAAPSCSTSLSRARCSAARSNTRCFCPKVSTAQRNSRYSTCSTAPQATAPTGWLRAPWQATPAMSPPRW